ncbi:myotubularin-related protein 10-A-like isoform X2 [Rhopilema esculentum]|eukprot:gene13749-4672_t
MSAAKRPVASLDRRERQIDKPPLLNGETILAEAQSVLKYNKMSKRGSGVMGSLYITNFKLAFMMTKIESTSSLNQRMMQLSCRALDDLLVYDESSSDSEFIPLTSISYLTAISTVKQVSKRLTPGKVPSKKYDIIEISCKDFRVVQFDFSLCRDKERAAVINTIHVYSSPTSLYKLFAFDYARGANNAAKASARGRAFHTFRHEKDLELELARLRAQEHWRISRVNEDFALCKTLPELNLVPSSLDDDTLKSVSGFYVDGRFPTLVWHSRETGAALLSSSAPSDQEDVNGGHSQKIIQGICDGLFGTAMKVPIVVDASLLFPSLKELQASYCELFGSSLYHTSKDYWASDSTWLSKVDNSRWLQYVQTALTAASEIANSLLIGQTSVIVHDLSGRDFTPLLVSLVQLLVDPYYRTVIGLESLIQKEWVVKGHPFSQRLGPIKEATKSPKNMIFYRDEYVLDTNESPIFILFLDCVHQLLTQFPSRFGFTEQFLLLLIDGVYMCLFETFLFDTEYDRKKFNSNALESLWDFLATKIPPEKFKTLFLNQFYNIDKNTTQNYYSL